MYTSFYGFREKPFSLSPDPRYLFLAASHAEALAHLLYGIEHGEGFIAITGEVGTGKTTLSRTLLQQLPTANEVAFILNPDLSAFDLLCAINEEFGLPTSGLSKREVHDQLNHFLLERNQAQRRVLLIIDEAQNLPTDTLEQVRLLSNLETDTAKLLQIILLGQPELEAKLHKPELRQLRQRITVWWKLAPLSVQETREYVQHRLRIASGGERRIFLDEALSAAHRLTGGIPRLINVLCDRALLAAYAENVLEVDTEIVKRVARELSGHEKVSFRDRLKEKFSGRGFARKNLHPLLIAGLSSIAILGASFGYFYWVSGGVDLWRGVRERATSPKRDLTASPTLFRVEDLLSISPETEVAALAKSGAADEKFAPVPWLLPEALPSRSLLQEDLPLSSVPFAQALAQTPPSTSYLCAANAMLQLWGMAPVASEALPMAGALLALEKQGLRTFWLHKATLDELQSVDQPALLIFSDENSVQRMVVLKHFDGERAILIGLDGETHFRVERAELEKQWSHSAVIPWRDFENLPDTLKPGTKGDTARWLQEQLRVLGLSMQEPSGIYDAQTASAVRRFQEQVHLGADGIVGVRTKLMLYGASPEYAVPKLRFVEDAG